MFFAKKFFSKVLLCLCLVNAYSFARVPSGNITVHLQIKNKNAMLPFDPPTLVVSFNNQYNAQELNLQLQNNLFAGKKAFDQAEKNGEDVPNLFFDSELLKETCQRFCEFWSDSSASGKTETWKTYTLVYRLDSSLNDFKYPVKYLDIKDHQDETIVMFQGFCQDSTVEEKAHLDYHDRGVGDKYYE
jgi:hypothetical protein